MAYTSNKIDSVRKWFTGVLPLVYDDALSYYEQISKFTDKVNEVIETTNKISAALPGIVGEGQNYYINVTNPGGTYKALVGDGNTDNTEAFQVLANLENAVLFFPAGVYATKPVTCKCDIVGAGALDSQILCLNDNTTKAGVTMIDNSNIYNIGINGNRGGQSEEKACLAIGEVGIDSGIASGIRCYNSYTGVDIIGNNVEVLGQFERCNASGIIHGDRALIVATEQTDSFSDEGTDNSIFTNYRLALTNNHTSIKSYNDVNVSATNNVSINGDSNSTLSGDTVNIKAKRNNAIEGTSVWVKASSDNVIEGNTVKVKTTNPLIYKTPTSINDYFKGVPITGEDGNVYQVLVNTDKSETIGSHNYVDIKDRGAVGDGVTDNYKVIQAAVNETGLIFVPAGNYFTSQPIEVPSNTTICGVGTLTGSNSIFSINTTGDAFRENITIRDVALVGGGNYAGIDILSHEGSGEYSHKNILFENLTIRNFYRGINAYGGAAVSIYKHAYPIITIRGCYVTECKEVSLCNSGVIVSIESCYVNQTGAGEAITIDNGCLRSRIVNTTIDYANDGGAGAIAFDEVEGLCIDNCVIRSAGSNPCIRANNASGNSEKVRITNNYLAGGSYNISLGTADHFTHAYIIGNVCSNASSEPLYLAPNADNIINIIGNEMSGQSANSLSTIATFGKNIDVCAKLPLTAGSTVTMSDQSILYIKNGIAVLSLEVTKTNSNGEAVNFNDGEIICVVPAIFDDYVVKTPDGSDIGIRPNGNVQLWARRQTNHVQFQIVIPTINKE